MKQVKITNIVSDNPVRYVHRPGSVREFPTTPPPQKSSEGLNKKKRSRIPQQWTVIGDTATADIGSGNIAIVDAIDLPLVQGRKWFPLPRGRTVYASHGKGILMHRLITGAGEGASVDHHNHAGLDNRRANLRVVDQKLNQANRQKQQTGTSQYKGVRWYQGKWQAACNRKYIGRFTDEVAAAMAYDALALKTWGRFACTNFPTTQAA